MPKIIKTLVVDVTPEKYLNNCTREELIETQLLLDKPYFQHKMKESIEQSIIMLNKDEFDKLKQ